MAEIEYGEFWLPGGSDAHPDNPLARCDLCSAIVVDQVTHSDWHASVKAPMPAGPYAWPWQCESCGGDIVTNGSTWMHVTAPGCDDLKVPLAAVSGTGIPLLTPIAAEPPLLAELDREQEATL